MSNNLVELAKNAVETYMGKTVKDVIYRETVGQVVEIFISDTGYVTLAIVNYFTGELIDWLEAEDAAIIGAWFNPELYKPQVY